MRFRISLAASACSSLATLLVAQGGVAPPGYAEHWGSPVVDASPLAHTDLRMQQLLEPAALPADLTPGRLLTGIGWRPGFGAPYAFAYAFDMEIRLFDTASTTLSATFAVNKAGLPGGVVMQRRVVSPATGTAYANPRDAFLMLPFDAPRVFTGPGLLVEVVNVDTMHVVLSRTIDACSAAPAIRLGSFGEACGPTANHAHGSAFANDYGIALTGGPPGATGAAFFGLDLLSAGGAQLPLALDVIGMPGCTWFVDAEVILPVTLDALGHGEVVLPVLPRVYSQWALLDTAANPLGAVMSTVGFVHHATPPCAMSHVWTRGQHTAPDGTLVAGAGLITRFEY